ncbi:hypothetical protein HZU77_002275 [Neisseriaceae bacterium TC5R-5]|nr:hypothetical protein [Neisseriaceae bacterium TC5R-5]
MMKYLLLTTNKKTGLSRFFCYILCNLYYLAADAAGAEASATGAEAAGASTAGAASGAEASTAGAEASTGASAFLPQADKATASKAATRSDCFIFSLPLWIS